MKECKKCGTIKDESEFYLIKSKNGKKYLCSPCKSCTRKRYLSYNKEKSDHRRQLRKDYNEIKKQKQKDKYHADPLYKRIVVIRNDLNNLVKYGNISPYYKENFGTDLKNFRAHIEAQFSRGMTWENRSRSTWHFDHIIPLKSAKTLEDLKKLCHYSNVRPMWAKKNMGRN